MRGYLWLPPPSPPFSFSSSFTTSTWVTMADYSSWTSRFRAIPREVPESRVTKRPRDSHVCVQCRKAKLKCDRNLPCASCVKRGDTANCAYPQSLGGNANQES